VLHGDLGVARPPGLGACVGDLHHLAATGSIQARAISMLVLALVQVLCQVTGEDDRAGAGIVEKGDGRLTYAGDGGLGQVGDPLQHRLHRLLSERHPPS